MPPEDHQPDWQPATRAVHGGRSIDPGSGAVATPLHLSTTFRRDADGGFARGFSYSRENNPNRAALERCLATLEGGAWAATFASGTAAMAAILQALPGEHPQRVLVPHGMYFGNLSLLDEPAISARLAVRSIDMTCTDTLIQAINEDPPTLLWLESPSNPLLEIVDIAAAAAAARRAGALVAVDNTWATPLLQQPLSLGADLSMHSVTKYLGGHSDLMAGVVVGRDDERGAVMQTRLHDIQANLGAVPSPFDCWLALRGVESLDARLRVQVDNAMRLADFLAGHPQVLRVHYPGLPGHAGHEIAGRQMRRPGAMLSFEVTGGRDASFRFCNALKLIIPATSLGGTHSLIEHRASIEGARTRAPQGLLRLSVGLEDVIDLQRDLQQALAASA